MLQAVATSDIIQTSLLTLWGNVAGFLPKFIAAVVVFLIGWLIAVLLGRAAFHIVRVIQLDKALEALGFRAIERGGIKLNAGKFFDEAVKWFFIIVFLLAAANIVGLSQVADFLSTVVLYIPHVIVAAIVILIGALVANFLEHSVRASVKAAELISGNFLALLTRWSVLIFAFLIALDQLKVAPEIIRIFIIGLVAMVAIGGGLAFGLGGQSHAEEWITNLRKRVRD
ncbi:MAG: hypothetical protein HYW77_00985 [Parcubacteria group bacterium]|nr:hypothetical protein [Parcubacteria group bacterium]